MRDVLKGVWRSEMLMGLRRLKQRLFPRPEHIGIGIDHPLRFTQKCRGVIHIGAHEGEEAWIYNALMVPRVLWVEGDPDLMPALSQKLMSFRRQTAVQALLTERDGEAVKFYVTNNDGASSSVLPLGRCNEMYPEIQVIAEKTLISSTLETLLHKYDPLAKLDGMVIDVQGAELAVLKGAGKRLKQFRWIFAECADFELYKGCCTLQSLSEFLSSFGFKESARYPTKITAGVGTALDVLFGR